MRSLRAHLELERTKRVVAIREKGNVLVHLQALRVQHLLQASFRFRIQRLHKTKAFAGGFLVVFLFSKLSVLLPTMTSKWCFFAHQLRTSPPSMPTLNAPSGRGKRSHSL